MTKADVVQKAECIIVLSKPLKHGTDALTSRNLLLPNAGFRAESGCQMKPENTLFVEDGLERNQEHGFADP